MRESPSPDCKGFVPVCLSGNADYLPSLMEKKYSRKKDEKCKGKISKSRKY